jgi:hypothetical protein
MYVGGKRNADFVFKIDLRNKNMGLVLAANWQVPCRVARWFVFKAKIQIWVNFGGS